MHSQFVFVRLYFEWEWTYKCPVISKFVIHIDWVPYVKSLGDVGLLVGITNLEYFCEEQNHYSKCAQKRRNDFQTFHRGTIPKIPKSFYWNSSPLYVGWIADRGYIAKWIHVYCTILLVHCRRFTCDGKRNYQTKNQIKHTGKERKFLVVSNWQCKWILVRAVLFVHLY